MQKQIDIGQFRLTFLFILYPALVDAQDVLENFIAQSGDKDMVLVYATMESECC